MNPRPRLSKVVNFQIIAVATSGGDRVSCRSGGEMGRRSKIRRVMFVANRFSFSQRF